MYYLLYFLGYSLSLGKIIANALSLGCYHDCISQFIHFLQYWANL